MCEVQNCSSCEAHFSMDLKTPRNVHLTAFYKRSFAFYTVNIRLPVIITQTIDSLVRNKDVIREEYGREGQEDLKFVVGELSRLKYEIQTNKPFEVIRSNANDATFYNEYLKQQASSEYEHPSYYNSIWLHCECYMYRRIREAFELTNVLQSYDPFRVNKKAAFESSLQAMKFLGEHLLNSLNCNPADEEMEFVQLLKLNLWGNKCDLSLSLGVVKSNEKADLGDLDRNILVDNSKAVWKVVSNINTCSQIIDIVLDNSGYELFSDLCMADFIISKGFAQKIRIYVKTIPWFISDVMLPDFEWFMSKLKKSEDEVLNKLYKRWNEYISKEIWTVEEHDFWTLPVDFSYMQSVDPELYHKLSEAKITLYKGDLNYRKLFGEKNWDPETPLNVALQGFLPAKLCTLRTIKADIVVGVSNSVVEEVEAKDKDWMINGNYGLIQFCDHL